MDTRLLEDALLLLEEQNLSSAASRRHVTQPAFSRRIRTLEQWIGRDILLRRPNRVDISPILTENEPRIRALLAQLQQLRGQLLNPQLPSEPLVIATQHSLSVSVVPDIIQKARSRIADLSVRLRSQNRDTAMSMFLRHEADVLISHEDRALPEAPFDDTVSREVWLKDTLVPLVGGSMRHNLAEGDRLPEDAHIITYPPESHFGQIVANHQRTRRLALTGSIAVESAFSVGVVQLVLAGAGAAWIPYSMVEQEVRAGNATILSADYGRISLDIMLYIHKANKKAAEFKRSLADIREP